MTEKPMSFTVWLDLVYQVDPETFKQRSDKLKELAHQRYNRYLMGWERQAGTEVGSEFYLINEK